MSQEVPALLVCTICRVQVATSDTVEHFSRHALEADNGRLYCGQCNETLLPDNIRQHFFAHIEESMAQFPECDECGAQITADEAAVHALTHVRGVFIRANSDQLFLVRTSGQDANGDEQLQYLAADAWTHDANLDLLRVVEAGVQSGDVVRAGRYYLITDALADFPALAAAIEGGTWQANPGLGLGYRLGLPPTRERRAGAIARLFASVDGRARCAGCRRVLDREYTFGMVGRASTVGILIGHTFVSCGDRIPFNLPANITAVRFPICERCTPQGTVGVDYDYDAHMHIAEQVIGLLGQAIEQSS